MVSKKIIWEVGPKDTTLKQPVIAWGNGAKFGFGLLVDHLKEQPTDGEDGGSLSDVKQGIEETFQPFLPETCETRPGGCAMEVKVNGDDMEDLTVSLHCAGEAFGSKKDAEQFECASNCNACQMSAGENIAAWLRMLSAKQEDARDKIHDDETQLLQARQELDNIFTYKPESAENGGQTPGGSE